MPNIPVTETASPRTKTPRSTRDRILEAAVSVLASRGYHDTKIGEIVSRSGTSKGGFYFHFPSKERMVFALVDQLAEKLVHSVERSMGTETRPEYRLAISVESLMLTFTKRRKLAQVILINAVGHGRSHDKKFLPIRNRFSTLIQQELDLAVRDELEEPLDTGLASHLWLGAFHQVLLAWLMADSPASSEVFIPNLQRMLLLSIGLPRERLPEPWRK